MVLAKALDDLGAPVEEIAELAVAKYVDLCAVEVVGGAKAVRGHRLPAPESWSPLQGVAPSGAAVLGRGQVRERAGVRRMREQLGAASLVWAPILINAQCAGALVLATSADRDPLGPNDIQLAKDLAVWIAVAAERVRLYRESVAQARSQATLAEGMRRLGSVAAAVAGAVTSDAVLRTACTDACAIFDAEAVAACWGSSPPAKAVVGAADPTDADAALDAALTGQSDPPGWVTAVMSRADGQRGAIGVRSTAGLSNDEQLMLTYLAAVLPVALERTATTQAWRKHEAQLEAVLSAAPVAIVTVRPDGRVISANPKGRQLFGWRSGHAKLGFADNVRPAMVQVALDTLARGSVTDRPVSNGDLDLLVSAVPFHGAPAGKPSVLVVATDVGEERRVERVLLQAQRLEAMGQVAGGVAHDFNNLLTVMIGYTAMLRRRLADRRELGEVDQLEIAVNRAADLTRKLLGFARRQLESPVTVDLAATTRQLHELLQTVAGPDVNVELDAPLDVIPVLADPATVEQMVVNLSLNARDAMDGHGRLTLMVDTVDLDSEQAAKLGLAPGAYARLCVADDGPGMTDDVLARCLEPFFTTKERGKGSGLGLSTVYGQAVGYGGTLTIETHLAAGTTIRVWLPVSQIDAVAAEAPTQEPPARLTGRILLVDDHDDLRALAVQALTDAGLDVIDAASGEAALDQADQACDLLVTDIVLPGMNGVDLATRMRTLQPQLPVLFVSGYADSQTRRWGLVEGSQLLRKPYGPDVLCRRIGDLLRYAPKR
jgi:two-component system, cell cycle sensor histidine kinase and response regulator CckA